MQRIDVNAALALIHKTVTGAPIPDPLAKAWTQPPTPTSGLASYDLEAPAKLLYPVLTPLRNSTPRVGGGKGTAVNWRAITGINTTNMEIGVGEGQRGGVLSHTTQEFIASYKGIGAEDNVTFEADMSAEGFDDVKARAVQGTLSSVMIGEERIMLGGNGQAPLGTTPTPSLSTATTGGTIPNAAANSVICVALTMQGFRASSVSAAGVPGLVTRNNADGTQITYGGGSAQQSVAASIATTGSNASTISATVTPVRQAFAYAWFLGNAAGAERIAAITTLNSVKLTALPSGGNQLASAITSPAQDNSVNSYVFDGYTTFAMRASGGGYFASQATGTAGTGTPLTADGKGGIREFDTALLWFWDNYKLSPNEIWVSAQQQNDIAAMVLAAGTNAAQRFVFDVSQGQIRGGTMVMSYLNKFGMAAADAQGEYANGKEIPIKVHPDLPPGTVFFRTKELPYKMSNVGNVAQIKTRRDYYQLEWPLRTRMYEYGVYSDEVLQVYAPFAMGILNNIAPSPVT